MARQNARPSRDPRCVAAPRIPLVGAIPVLASQSRRKTNLVQVGFHVPPAAYAESRAAGARSLTFPAASSLPARRWARIVLICQHGSEYPSFRARKIPAYIRAVNRILGAADTTGPRRRRSVTTPCASARELRRTAAYEKSRNSRNICSRARAGPRTRSELLNSYSAGRPIWEYLTNVWESGRRRCRLILNHGHPIRNFLYEDDITMSMMMISR